MRIDSRTHHRPTEVPEQGIEASDARLIEEIRQGNRDAFGKLVERYEHRLVRVILRFVSDLDLAEDLAQDAFLKVYKRIEQFDPSRRFSPWLFRIGVNLAMDHFRRRRRRVWTILFSDQNPDRWQEPSAADKSGQQDLQREVRRIIDMLPERYRTVIVLRDMENFSSSEIAAILNRKEATIRWRLAEARIRFQELWERHHVS